MSRFFQTLVIAVSMLSTITGCLDQPHVQVDSDNGKDAGTGRLTIYTVNYPLQYFAQRIGGEHVKVIFPTPAGEDPAIWSPDADTVSAYQRADLILLNGAGYANWVSRVTLPASKVIRTTSLVESQIITIQDATAHSHGPGQQHTHAGVAFTTWLDPDLCVAQANAIKVALAARRPQHQKIFTANFERLKSDLNELDARLAQAASEAAQHPIIFSHPVYQYLERKYALHARTLHWEPDTMPSPEDWNELRKLLAAHPARWMIWEGPPREDIETKLSDLDVRCIVFAPCGNRPPDNDWLQVMARNAEQLARLGSSAR